MKHILIAGLLIAATAGSALTSPVRAADNDRRGGTRDRGPRRDDNDNDGRNRPGRPDWNRDRDHGGRDGDWNHDHDRDRNGRDRWNNRGDNRPWRNWPTPGDRYNRPGYNRGNNGGYGYGYGGNYGYNDGYGYGGNYGYGGVYNRPGTNNGYGNGYGNYGNLESVANRIQSALRSDGQLRRYNIGTDTVGNTIELEGTVRSASDRQRAIDIARRISGGVIINATRLQVRR